MNNPRVLAAFLLSLLFLLVWNTVFPPVQPSPKTQQKIPSTSIDSQQKTDREESLIDDIQETSQVKANDFNLDDRIEYDKPTDSIKIITLENERLRLEIDEDLSLVRDIYIKNFQAHLPIQLIGLMDAGFQVRLIKRTKYSAEWKIISSDSKWKNKNLEWTKNIQIGKNTIVLNFSSLEKNISNLNFKIFDIVHEQSELEHLGRDRSLNEIFYKIENKVVRKNNAVKFNEKFEIKTNKFVQWFGFRNRYFCFVVKPMENKGLLHVKVMDEHRLRFIYISEGSNDGNEFQFKIYAGPQSIKLLRENDPDFSEVMKFSRFGLLDFTAKMIYELLLICHKIIPNWGLSILFISIFIYMLMFPLTLKGMASMKKMQALQPKIVKLREKYKNNPQKLNKEMMELYQKHKINPLSGCLPLILQMPVFIGLYQVLWRSVDLKGQGFLWIKDLSEPDRLMILPFHIPILGNELNLLPILMMIAMVFQQKVSAMSQTTTDPQQRMQQKLMMTIFPVFLGVIFYKFPSGLNLYFTVFYMLSTFTQWKISRMKWSFDDESE